MAGRPRYNNNRRRLFHEDEDESDESDYWGERRTFDNYTQQDHRWSPFHHQQQRKQSGRRDWSDDSQEEEEVGGGGPRRGGRGKGRRGGRAGGGGRGDGRGGGYGANYFMMGGEDEDYEKVGGPRRMGGGGRGQGEGGRRYGSFRGRGYPKMGIGDEGYDERYYDDYSEGWNTPRPREHQGRGAPLPRERIAYDHPGIERRVFPPGPPQHLVEEDSEDEVDYRRGQDQYRRDYREPPQRPRPHINRGGARFHPPPRRTPQGLRKILHNTSSEEEDSDDSIYKRNRQCQGRVGSTPNLNLGRNKREERRITPEFLISILDEKRDLQVTLLHLLEHYKIEIPSVRHLVSANPNLFILIGETVKLNVKIDICSAHNGTKGCFNRATCKDLHICSKYVDNKCQVKECVMGHSWKTKHNGRILEDLSIKEMSQRSLAKLLQSSLALNRNTSHNIPNVCYKYNHSKCQRQDCQNLHMCFNFVIGRSKCAKLPCKLNHDVLSPSCRGLLEDCGIDVNESPRDVLAAFLEANPSLKKKEAEEMKNTSTQDPDPASGPANEKASDAVKPPKKDKDDTTSKDTKKAETKKKKNHTVWAYHVRGNVEIAEICFDSVESTCPNESTGCKKLHALDHFHWQVSENGTSWLNLQTHQCEALECSFCDVNSDTFKIPRFDPTQQKEFSNGLLVLLGRDMWVADFSSMKITDSKKTKTLQIRRLCTEVIPGKKITPSCFNWYFIDKQQNWIEYGKVDSLGEINLVSSLTSDAIEQQFLKDSSTPLNFNNSQFNYILDFQSMTQTNQHTQVTREVRRRPQPHLQMKEKDQQGKQQRLPSEWDQMQPNERMKLVPITANSEEYNKIIQLLGNTVSAANVVKLERVQNRFHWNAFKNKTEEMASIYGDISKVVIQQLFHGTGANIVSKICSENFDPRLHGLSAGQAYGQGTYFARDASLSYGYCKADSSGLKYMFVATVAVGSMTLGNSSMARPPINSSTGMPFDSTVDNATNPSIIVKYDKSEYYPQYIFTLM